MATEITMPRLSDSMEEGTILKWLVDEGGEVKKGEPLVEIETDKANMTYEADTDGTLVEVLAKEGETKAVGDAIARVGDASEKGGGSEGDEDDEADAGDADDDADADGDGDGDASGDDEAEAGDEDSDADADDDADDDDAEESEADADDGDEDGDDSDSGDESDSRDGGGERIKASPVARRLAEQEGVELQAVEGTGPGGRITKADVEGASGEGQKRSAGGAKGAVEVTELTRLQQTVSRRMAESKATAPDYVLTLDVDMTLAVELRERLNDAAEHPPSFNDMVIKAVANALREFPRVNGAYRDGKFEQYSRVNVGVAVAAQDALVVPTIFDADSKSLGQIARDAYELAEKVREGKITPPEVAGGTFTVSNLGMYGIDEFTAVINPPQAAILTVGALKKKPAVDDNGRIVARDQMRLSLVSDHRILYGADAAEFLARVRELLEQPLQLAL
jgi:pyruvate dehydrogenase E2 component (dihydrolipoyllysine-residue acetyltransferase)